MTNKEVMQMALDWIEAQPEPRMIGAWERIKALRTALAQPDCVCGEPDSEGIHCKDNPCFMINGLTKEQTNETMSVKGLTSHE